MTDHEDVNGVDPDARSRIQSSLEGVLDKATLDSLLTEVLAIKRQARGWCKECSKAVPVEIPDAKAVVSAMGELLTQRSGVPERSPRTTRRTTVFYNVITTCSHRDDDEVIQNGMKLEPEEAARVIADQLSGRTE